MKLTPEHATYWMERRGPKCLRGLRRTPVSIDDLIPHPRMTSNDCTRHNTMQLLRRHRRRGQHAMLEALTHMSVGLPCPEGKQRSAFCLRIINKIRKHRRKKQHT